MAAVGLGRAVARGHWDNPDNHRAFFDEIAKSLGITKYEDWYKIRNQDVYQKGGGAILNSFYNSSLPMALKTLYPEHQWRLWKFHKVPVGFWDDMSNQREFFEWCTEHLEIKTWEGWYSVNATRILELGGGTLMSKFYNGNLQKALSTIYPQHDWETWRFERVPHNHWTTHNHKREFFEGLAKQLNLTCFDDWYKVTMEEVLGKGGHSILRTYHNGSLIGALQEAFPEHPWQPWRFPHPPRGWWDDIGNQKQYMEWLEKEMNIKQPSDWGKVTRADLVRTGGSQFAVLYGDSVLQALAVLYPNQIWDLDKVPKGFWDDTSKHALMFDKVGKILNVQEPAGWYNVKTTDLKKITGATSILHLYYEGSICKALETVYPQYQWQKWLFTKVPRGYWSDQTNVRDYIAWITNQLSIQHDTDWYKLTSVQLGHLRGATLLKQNSGIVPFLEKYCPRFSQKTARNTATKTQKFLVDMMQRIFPAADVWTNYRHPMLKYNASGHLMELDVYLPGLSLALEYQGGQHYVFNAVFGMPQHTARKDAEKQAACSAQGITLIEIPYWWDYSKEALLASITKVRPDVLAKNITTIAS